MTIIHSSHSKHGRPPLPSSPTSFFIHGYYSRLYVLRLSLVIFSYMITQVFNPNEHPRHTRAHLPNLTTEHSSSDRNCVFIITQYPLVSRLTMLDYVDIPRAVTTLLQSTTLLCDQHPKSSNPSSTPSPTTRRIWERLNARLALVVCLATTDCCPLLYRVDGHHCNYPRDVSISHCQGLLNRWFEILDHDLASWVNIQLGSAPSTLSLSMSGAGSAPIATASIDGNSSLCYLHYRH